ncbi:MAG TPA: hypothetical protein VF532_22390, partial [Candidatus Angelobacter sp.]
MRFSVFAFLLFCAAPLFAAPPADAAKPAEFKVTYAEVGTVYLAGGKSAGLREGMTLVIRRARAVGAGSDHQFKGTVIVAKLTVVSVSGSSAMCRVRGNSSPIQRGDIATLAPEEHDALSPMAALGSQGVNQPERTSVLGPAMAKLGSENTPANPPPPPAPAPALAKTTNAPMTIADAARINRGEAARTQATVSTVPATAPAPTPATTATPAITVTSTPMSVAEAARLKRKAAAEAAVAANRPAPTSVPSPPPASAPAPTTAAKANNPVPAPAQPPVVTTANNTAPPATPAKSPEAEKKKLETGATPATAAQTVKAAPPAPEPKPASAPTTAVASNAPPASATTTVARQTPPQASAKNEPVPATPAEKPAPAISAAPSEKKAAEPVLMAANIPPARTPSASLPSGPSKTAFNVKYVAEDAVYIDAGKNAGLTEGMGLTVKKSDAVIAEIAVVSVSNTSAVCEIRSKTADIQRGDLALLQQSDVDKMAQTQAMGPTRKYPQVVAFSQGDPLDEEVREAIPKPPPTEINRGRGRIGLDSTFINNTGTSASQSIQLGAVVRADLSRIGGTYWNLNGYWRGRLNTFTSTSATQPQSVFDLINRTYTIGFTYLNPKSRWTAGVGRLYLPWAP